MCVDVGFWPIASLLAALADKQAMASNPIVFGLSSEPIKDDLVSSLSAIQSQDQSD
jgi:hypothetical protein